MRNFSLLILVSILLFSSCKRFVYTSYEIELASINQNMQGTSLHMMPTDAQTINFELNMKLVDAKGMTIGFRDLPSTISYEVLPFKTDTDLYGEEITLFSVTFKSVKADSKTYPIKLFTNSKQGLFRELPLNIKVIDFDIRSMVGYTYPVNDTLSDDPFSSMVTLNLIQYDMKITEKVGGNNEMIFDKIGSSPSANLFYDVEAIVNKSTGEIVIPQQTHSGLDITGYGQLRYVINDYRKYRGYIMYKYQTTFGDKYEGKAAF
ncbi:MAG TPA: hypothetical protein PLU17_10815 [Chitinophagaceae bacterium]|nr:hypothetical protein [Chitinophagaceae bacterium]